MTLSAPLTPSMMETSLWSRSASPDSMRIYDVLCCSKKLNANKQNMFDVNLKGHRRLPQLSDIFVQQQLRREHGEVPPGSQDHHARQVFFSLTRNWMKSQLTTRRDIKAGEEVSDFYGQHYFQAINSICWREVSYLYFQHRDNHLNTQKLSATVKS